LARQAEAGAAGATELAALGEGAAVWRLNLPAGRSMLGAESASLEFLPMFFL
jgi:hypothetical protein